MKPGDVFNEHGDIFTEPPGYCITGNILVDEAQAKAAEVYGWKRVGVKEHLIIIERMRHGRGTAY